MVYWAVGNYCGLDLQDLTDLGSTEQIKRALDVLGFLVIERNTLPTARSLVGRSRYKKRCDSCEAPQTVDCSSFIKWIYGQLGVWMPRYAVQQFECGTSVELHQLQERDLIFTKGANPIYLRVPNLAVGHVGMYTGDGSVIHAANTQRGVVEDELEGFVGTIPHIGCKRIVNLESFVTLRIPSTRSVETSEDIRVHLIRNHKLLRPT